MGTRYKRHNTVTTFLLIQHPFARKQEERTHRGSPRDRITLRVKICYQRMPAGLAKCSRTHSQNLPLFYACGFEARCCILYYWFFSYKSLVIDVNVRRQRRQFKDARALSLIVWQAKLYSHSNGESFKDEIQGNMVKSVAGKLGLWTGKFLLLRRFLLATKQAHRSTPRSRLLRTTQVIKHQNGEW